jgi:hypothetical protein
MENQEQVPVEALIGVLLLKSMIQVSECRTRDANIELFNEMRESMCTLWSNKEPNCTIDDDLRV